MALRVIFVLLIIPCNLVLPMKIHEDYSDKHIQKQNELIHRRSKRQVPCDRGEYPGEHHNCKCCSEGQHVESECTEPHGEPVCKNCIEGLDFMDKTNGLLKCELCRRCQSSSGHEVLNPCTVSQNTVCKCKDGFFCAQNLSSPRENCEHCHHCTECDSGVAEPCTPTKNTVCNEQVYRCHKAIGFTIPAIAVLFGVLIFCLIRRKNKRVKESHHQAEHSPIVYAEHSPIVYIPTCPPHLENIKLDNHLYEFASMLVRESVLKCATKTLSPVEIEEVKINNLASARDEKYELLKRWYNAHGQQGAMKSLIENATRKEAEQMINLVQTQSGEP